MPRGGFGGGRSFHVPFRPASFGGHWGGGRGRHPWAPGGWNAPPVVEQVFDDPAAYDDGSQGDDGSGDQGDDGSDDASSAPAAASGLPVVIVGSAYVPSASQGSRLATLAPIMAPGARGAQVTLHYHPATRVVSASLCIDGRCYSGQADLSELLSIAANSIASYHSALHGDPNAPAAIAQVQGEADAIIACAGEHLAHQAMDQHREVAVAGWWHDLTKKVKGIARGAERGIEGVARGAVSEVGHTLVQLKGPITAAATMAAGAAAASLIGPEAAPIAAQLAGSLMGVATGSASVQQAAQQVISQAQQVAQTNPQVAAALNIAHQAVAQSTIAHQVAQTAANAAAGSSDAQSQLAELAQAATQGDPAAQQLSALASDLGSAMDASDTADAAVTSGAAHDLLAQIHETIEASPGRVVGYVIPHGNPPEVKTFATADQADDWFGTWLQMPEAFSYLAYFDKQDPSYPGPLNEQYGRGDVKSSGVLPYFLLGGAGAAAGAYFWPALHAKLAQKWPKYFHIG